MTNRMLQEPRTEAAEPSAPSIDFASPEIGQAELDEVLETLRSGWLIAGPRVAAFERQLESRLEARHVRCLSSCSAGLMLALRCGGVGPGDEVLLPAITFVGCANAIEQVGARPVLVDVDPATGLIDLDRAAALVGPRTRALMAVHLGGRPIDIDRLNAFRDRFGVPIVEDAAHAIGATWGGHPIGSHGNATSFSFHATKNMTTIEGGALACSTEAEAARVRRLAAQGVTASAWERHGSTAPGDYDVIEPGYKLAMTDVAAALGLHQLRRLDEAIDRREQLRLRYDDALADLPLELEPDVGPHARHARHLYAVRLRDDAPLSRDELILGLRRRGVGTSIHFKGIHQLTYYARRCGIAPGELPAATRWALRTVSLPLYPMLSEADHERVVHAVAELIRR